MADSAAVEPEPEQPTEKTWEVIGPTAFKGTKPGDTFKAALPLDQERRAVARGSIREAAAKKPAAKKTTKKKPSAQKPPANDDKKE